MPNQYNVWQVYTNETLMILKNKLQLLGNVNRDNEYLFAKKGMKAGNSVNLRYPARFLGRSGETYTPESYAETSYSLVIRPLQGVDVDLPSTDWTLSLDDVKKRVLAPAAAQLANNIERDCLQIARANISNTVGAAGSIPNTLKTYNQARAMLVNEGFPDDTTNCLMISPDMQVEIANSMSTLFNPAATVDTVFKRGLLGEGYGFKWYESANLWMQGAGTRVASAGTLSASPASGSSTFAVTGFGASATILAGETFTLAASNAVNPMVRQSLGKLRHFTVTQTVTLSAGGTGNLQVSPAIQYGATNAFANVDSQPGANAAIVFDQIASTNSMQGLAWSPEALTWACINQEDPSETNAECYFATDPETSIQLRFARQWEGRTNNYINRYDVLYAFGVPYPTGAVRVWSAT
jgi:hypothetical protein